MDKRTFERIFVEKLEALRGISIEESVIEDQYAALASIIKEQVTRQWVSTNNSSNKEKKKQVYYFSLEFMLGKMLESNILALGLGKVCREALGGLGLDVDKIFEVELDPGLGNGGLGRLAACFMDSMAFIGLPGNGCSIRYKYGLFEQKIVDGYQVEMPDNWLRNENVWEIKKPNKAVRIRFFGNVKEWDENGRKCFGLENYEEVIAMPYDVPMVGYGNGVVNNLRLWSAESPRQFDFGSFSSGDYINAVSGKYSAEAISEVLYPDDSNYQNRMLRLKQQYFFVSAGVQSIIRHHKRHYGDVRCLHEYVAIHINDTHPAVAVPELMRILMDDEGLGWDEAWEITVKTISYTNHTIMPEALEKWPLDAFANMLPRIYMIVHEINERFCRMLYERLDGDLYKISRMAIEADNEIKMAYLAIAGSHATNGVAKVHSGILKNELFRDFSELYPERFNNKTNGVTHRRWMLKANPEMSELISSAIGDGWIMRPPLLRELDSGNFVRDSAFLERLREIKRINKIKLCQIISDCNGVTINPDSIFDVQVKRIHAYKRQLLMVLHIMDMYYSILDNPNGSFTPRTFIFSGKAAPSYHFAKETIKLINTVAEIINNDTRVRDLIKVVFLENYRVSLAERIFPASDLSEQISTAGLEASGTGNMKFMMNGAVTIGTLDGANIEILEAVGEENFIRFGLTVSEVLELKHSGSYHSWDFYNNDSRVRRIADNLINTRPGQIGLAEFPHIYDSLLTYNDEFLVLKDFSAYIEAQRKATELYLDRSKWSEVSALNIARSGSFSSDEVIRRYAEEIWLLPQYAGAAHPGGPNMQQTL